MKNNDQKPTKSPFAALKIDVAKQSSQIDLTRAGYDQNKDKTQDNEIFAHGLPDWDLLPDNLIVRRNNNVGK